jgi:hypothetical protein
MYFPPSDPSPASASVDIRWVGGSSSVCRGSGLAESPHPQLVLQGLLLPRAAPLLPCCCQAYMYIIPHAHPPPPIGISFACPLFSWTLARALPPPDGAERGTLNVPATERSVTGISEHRHPAGLRQQQCLSGGGGASQDEVAAAISFAGLVESPRARLVMQNPSTHCVAPLPPHCCRAYDLHPHL